MTTTKSRKELESKYRDFDHDDHDVARDHLLESDSTENLSRHHRGRLDYRAGFFAILTAYLLTVTLALAVWLFRSNSSGSDATSLSKILQVSHDQRVTFDKVEIFEKQDSGIGLASYWDTLEPTGKGFIEISVDGEKQKGCISMFHQLHCLATLKRGLESGSGYTEHYGHCFDYLRQAVMCAGDVTIEPVMERSDGSVQLVDGWGVEHQCRNFEMIKEFAETHTYLNTTGIL